jgi:hypothetical protein
MLTIFGHIVGFRDPARFDPDEKFSDMTFVFWRLTRPPRNSGWEKDPTNGPGNHHGCPLFILYSSRRATKPNREGEVVLSRFFSKTEWQLIPRVVSTERRYKQRQTGDTQRLCRFYFRIDRQ